VIEIIAVLVILGILAAVGFSRYLNLADETRIKAAQGAIAEVKGRLASAQAKYMMHNNGIAPTSLQLYNYATSANAYVNVQNLSNVGSDFVATVATGTPIPIAVTVVQGTTVANVTGNFRAAGDP